ncbi:MAG: sensor histidine kinase [Phycisphaerales bacterium]|nr:MAG: sensor histidine kinase [Phycisphaerales bacterium]
MKASFALQRAAWAVDGPGIMRDAFAHSSFRRSEPDRHEPRRAADPPLVREIAHELNSLLDGIGRCVQLARTHLGQPDDAEHKLALAGESIDRMKTLLEGLMHREAAGLAVFNEQQPVGETINAIIRSVAAEAEAAGVTIDTEISPEAAALPTGPLGTVIQNGLRNAIQACARTGRPRGHVELSVCTSQRRELIMLIADTGPGPLSDRPDAEPHGHGIGLELSRRIVESLGGRMELLHVPFGTGAVLKIHVAIRELLAHAESDHD